MAKRAKSKEGKRGRPSKYREEYCGIGHDLALLGKTEEEIAKHFGVNQNTITEWKKKFPKFSAAIQSGKLPADGRVARALYERAIGYSHPAVKFFVVNGEVVREEYIEHYPPDYNCLSLWLRNRHPELWRDKQIIDTGEKAASHFHELMEMWKRQPHTELPIDASE